MLSAHLIRTIEIHAEELTRGLLDDLARNPRTPAFHGLTREELHGRVYDVYHNLGRWLAEKDERHIEQVYGDLGRRRHHDHTPVSELLYAVILVKDHLRAYIRRIAAANSAVEMYQEAELNLLIGHFFDKALYHSVKGYEEADVPSLATSGLK
jgi:hypothetical protein